MGLAENVFLYFSTKRASDKERNWAQGLFLLQETCITSILATPALKRTFYIILYFHTCGFKIFFHFSPMSFKIFYVFTPGLYSIFHIFPPEAYKIFFQFKHMSYKIFHIFTPALYKIFYIFTPVAYKIFFHFTWKHKSKSLLHRH